MKEKNIYFVLSSGDHEYTTKVGKNMEGSSSTADKSTASTTNQAVPDADHCYQSKSETPATQQSSVTSKLFGDI